MSSEYREAKRRGAMYGVSKKGMKRTSLPYQAMTPALSRYRFLKKTGAGAKSIDSATASRHPKDPRAVSKLGQRKRSVDSSRIRKGMNTAKRTGRR